MTISFAIIAIIVIASGVAAMTMRNLVHCALSLIVTLGGLAGIYLQLGAQFIGFAQILVYVGAVAILIVFALRQTALLAARRWATPLVELVARLRIASLDT